MTSMIEPLRGGTPAGFAPDNPRMPFPGLPVKGEG